MKAVSVGERTEERGGGMFIKQVRAEYYLIVSVLPRIALTLLHMYVHCFMSLNKVFKREKKDLVVSPWEEKILNGIMAFHSGLSLV